MKINRILVTICSLILVILLVWSSKAGILGTDHDFSKYGWNLSGEICIVCHAPHNAKTATQGLLWNHEMTSAVFVPYSSPSLKATVGQPDGASKLCLSCHDGTVALDRFAKITEGGSAYVMGYDNLGTDLSNDHPISFVYDSALAAAKKTLKDPTIAPSGLGNTIAQDMLRAGKLQCVSCHDPHNRANIPALLVKSNSGSALCMTCHTFGN